jgi:hypothetical protein
MIISVSYRNWWALTPIWSKAWWTVITTGVTRYTTSTFLRMKIGDALKERKMAPHIYESREEAEAALKGRTPRA